jgi:U4/U6 small nuclear ribonucleoprotein PRP3
MRRQNRLEAQREKQDKIRLGLLPPEEARVTKSNFMRVLGHEAVLAPSMIEAEMERQVAERQRKHKELVDSQKLTEEERKAKKDRKLRENTSEIVKSAVFRINRRPHNKQLFKVNANAKQLKLSGVCILNAEFNVVIVEGGPKGLKSFKNLMLNRIDWNEKFPLENPDDIQEPNQCTLVWEGDLNFHYFKYFSQKSFESHLDLKDYLDKMGVEHYWKAARTFVSEEY